MTINGKSLIKGFEPKNVRVLFEKNARNQIWAYESGYNGKTLFHLREIYETADGEWAPSKSGVSVPVEKKAELLSKLD